MDIISNIIISFINNIIRKIVDTIGIHFNKRSQKTYLSVETKVDSFYRRFLSYGTSCGEIIDLGNYKANYLVEVELKITIQNESSVPIYSVTINYIPNQYFNKYSIIDIRDNKLQPLEGNKSFDFQVKIIKNYYNAYARDVDKDLCNLKKNGEGKSLLNGSVVKIIYKDYKHKLCTKTIKIE